MSYLRFGIESLTLFLMLFLCSFGISVLLLASLDFAMRALGLPVFGFTVVDAFVLTAIFFVFVFFGKKD